MKNKVLFMALIFACLFLCSCSNGWKKAKNVYKESLGVYTKYLNTDPKVDLQEKVGASPQEKKLARLFFPVDKRLQALTRSLDAQTTYPPKWWFEEIETKFSWTNGLLVLTKDGEIVKEQPKSQIKQIDPSVFFEKGVDWTQKQLVSFTVQTPLGPEMFVAGPFFEANKWQGIIAVHFDPRTLAGLSPNPDELLFFQKDKVLWPGKFNSEANILLQENWEEVLKDKVSGDVQAMGKKFYWISRFIGRNRLIYAVPMAEG